MDFLRQQLFNIIAFVFLGLFVAVWGSVLLRVGFWVPDGQDCGAAPQWSPGHCGRRPGHVFEFTDSFCPGLYHRRGPP